jgi:hypothetical protein
MRKEKEKEIEKRETEKRKEKREKKKEKREKRKEKREKRKEMSISVVNNEDVQTYRETSAGLA